MVMFINYICSVIFYNINKEEFRMTNNGSDGTLNVKRGGKSGWLVCQMPDGEELLIIDEEEIIKYDADK